MIDSFISYISGIRRYSEHTQSSYRDILERYALWSGVADDIISALTPSMIRSYEVYLLDDCECNERTVNLHLSVLSSFCRYLIGQNKLSSNPVRLVSRPKPSKRLASFYKDSAMKEYFDSTAHCAGEDELKLLLSYGRDVAVDKNAVRLYRSRLRRLIVSLLHGCGVRRAELLGLKRSSVDFRRQVISVHGKGDKMRDVPVPDALCDEIRLYMMAVDALSVAQGVEVGQESPLLLTEKCRPLYAVYVDKAVKGELGGVTGVTGRKSPHVLRHTLATSLLNDGSEINSIKELLGHSSLAATQVYTHNSIEKLKQAYGQAHPRAHKPAK